MKAGDRIRIIYHRFGETEDYTVEEFRYCLGVFLTEQRRQAEDFTPLCELYEPGPDSEKKYIGNYGEHHTNMVQAWADLPS
jgi:hypothetical protein